MLNTSSTPRDTHSPHPHPWTSARVRSTSRRRTTQVVLLVVSLTLLVALSVYQRRDHPDLKAALNIRPQSRVSSAIRGALLLQEDGGDGDECVGECKPFDSGVVDQCAYVREDCACEGIVEDGLGNYLTMYFCGLSGARWFAIIVMILLIVYLFLAIGLVAEDFFSPTMAGMADTLGLSHNVAGVTLLAFANGAPDVFASFSALTGGKEELGIGALYGAGSFITMVVIGLVCWVKPGAPVTRRPVFRDAIFLILAMITVFIFTEIGEIQVYQAVLVFLIYITYVMVVILGRILYQRSKITHRKAAASAWGDEPKYSAAARVSAKRAQKATPDDDVVVGDSSPSIGPIGVVDADSNPSIEPYQLRAVESRSPSPAMSESSTATTSSTSPLRAAKQPFLNTSVNGTHPPSNGIVPHIDAGVSVAEQENDLVEADTSVAARDRILTEIEGGEDEAEGEDDESTGPIERFINIIMKPVYFAARITVPLIDKDKWDWRLACVWPLTFFPFTFFVFGAFTVSIGKVPLMPFLMMVGAGVSFYMYRKLRTRTHKPFYKIFHLIMAFFAGVAWISLMADELVTVLAVLGVITGINQTILGLTILAWGNSVPDAVSNVTVAKFGYPQMAIGAALGGPIFNLLTGVGVSFILNTAKKNPFPMPGNGNITLAVIFIVCVVTMHMCFIVSNGWRLAKVQGSISFGLYFVFIALSVLIAVDVIPDF